jgi:hypothetical protein
VLAEEYLGDAEAVDGGGGRGAEQLAVGQPVADLVEEVARRDQAGTSRQIGLTARRLGDQRGSELVAVAAQHVATAGLPRGARDGGSQETGSLGLRHRQPGLRTAQTTLAQQTLDAEHEQQAERRAATAALDHGRRRRPVDLALQRGKREARHRRKRRTIHETFR